MGKTKTLRRSRSLLVQMPSDNELLVERVEEPVVPLTEGGLLRTAVGIRVTCLGNSLVITTYDRWVPTVIDGVPGFILRKK